MKRNIQRMLRDDLINLDRMSSSLNRALKTTVKLKRKKSFSEEEYVILDSLTSRFSRLSDIITQKALRTIDIINLEDAGTLRDRLNRAEKNGTIENIDDFSAIRKLRNDITHEYIPEEMIEIYKNVIKYSPVLVKTVKRIQNYCKKNFNI